MKYSDRAAFTVQGLADYVHGEAGAGADDAFGDPFAGAEGRPREGLTRRQLVDIVHPHLFSVPIVLFILGHLLHLTRLPDGLKLTINVVAFASLLATFLLPFAVLDHPGLAPLLVVSGWALMGAFALLCAVPLYELWLGKPGRGFDAIPRRNA
jgi:hypothetical protein